MTRKHALTYLYVPTQVALDIVILVFAFALAYALRFDFEIPSTELPRFLVQVPMVVLLQFVALTVAGARSSIWRYTDLEHVKSFVYAAVASFVLVLLLRVSLPDAHSTWRVPLSVNFIDVLLGFGGTYAVRVIRRAVYEYGQKKRQFKKKNGNGNGHKKRSVLLIGAGRAGMLAAKEIEARGDLDLAIKGFVDDDSNKLGRSIVQGRKVLGTTADLPKLITDLGINHVIITIAHASRSNIHRIVRLCEEIPVKVRIIPELYEIIEGRVEISRIRDVQIEDLLGRDPVKLDIESLNKELAGKTVMVTGAGGSIGSELARQAQRFAPANLLLVE